MFLRSFSLSLRDSLSKLFPSLAVEGYVIFVTNLNKETQDDDVKDFFEEYGPVKNVTMNIDRRTGYMKV